MKIAPARPWAHRALGAMGLISVGSVLALFALGVLMLATVVDWRFVVLGLILLAGLPVLVYGRARRRLWHLTALVPGLIAVPVLGLLAFDAVWAWVGLGRPGPEVGLVIAGIVVTSLGYLYLHWVGDSVPTHPGRWAGVALAAGLVLCALVRQRVPEPSLWIVAGTVGAAVWFYLHSTGGPKIVHPLGWAVLISVVFLVAVPLIVDATNDQRLSPILVFVCIPVGAVGLYLFDQHRRRHPHTRSLYVGGALLVAMAGVITFSFFSAVLGSEPAKSATKVPGMTNTMPLLPAAAIDHRPILLFDSGEQLHTPLNVDQVFQSGLIELCPSGRGFLAGCKLVTKGSDLLNGPDAKHPYGNLRFNTQKLESDTNLGTTIYVHVSTDRRNPAWQDLDYWWYLPDNPADTARGAMCGAGLTIPEITCFDHQSDWEGITVVVYKNGGTPKEVHYAEHNFVVDVDWKTLTNTQAKLTSYPAHAEAAAHPLVFLARGTHAAYPLPCSQDFCGNGTPFSDNQHDGKIEWQCSKDCVTQLPTMAAGSKPASWDAFTGEWGSAVCLGLLYCSESPAPKSPGTQPRYQNPACYEYVYKPGGELTDKPRHKPNC